MQERAVDGKPAARRARIVLAVLGVLAAAVPTGAVPKVAGDGGFVRGHFYATSLVSPTISHYDARGRQLAPLPLQLPPGIEPYALTQGPDGLLYIGVWEPVAREQGVPRKKNEILAVDSQGVVVRRYRCAEPCGTEIFFDAAGTLYAATGQGFTCFVGANPNPVKAVAMDRTAISALNAGLVRLPGGGFLKAEDKHIFELTSAGAVVREISPAEGFGDVHGIAYDAAAGTLFATDGIWLKKLDFATGRLIAKTLLRSGRKLVVTADGRLVVSAQDFSPQVFSRELRPLGAFAGVWQFNLAEIRIGQAAPDRPVVIPVPAGPAPTESGFVRGDFYATESAWGQHTIAHYDANGGALEPIQLALPDEVELHGLAQGPDGLLYVVAAARSVGSAVLALNRRGDILKRYAAPTGWSGALHFHTDGNFWVATSLGPLYFRRGDETSVTVQEMRFGIHRDSYRDLVRLPNGNFVGTLLNGLVESRSDGTQLREIASLEPGSNFGSLAYDAASASIYVWRYSHTAPAKQLVQLDVATGAVRRQAAVEGVEGGAMIVALDGRLVVIGSQLVAPQILSKDLRPVGAFAGPHKTYVTQIHLGRSRP